MKKKNNNKEIEKRKKKEKTHRTKEIQHEDTMI